MSRGVKRCQEVSRGVKRGEMSPEGQVRVGSSGKVGFKLDMRYVLLRFVEVRRCSDRLGEAQNG